MRLFFGICPLPTLSEPGDFLNDSEDTWPGLSSLELLELKGKILEQLWLVRRYVDSATHLWPEQRVDTGVAP